MIQKYSRYLVLEQFFDFPRKTFLVRELSRKINLSQPSVNLHLKALIREKLIVKQANHPYPVFKAVRENSFFKLLKTQNVVLRLYQTDFLEYLEKELYPACIVLFGSASRGEDTETSDIDLFVQAKQEQLSLNKWEKVLNRKINILFETDTKSLGPELLNNLANGTVLYGYLKVA